VADIPAQHQQLVLRIRQLIMTGDLDALARIMMEAGARPDQFWPRGEGTAALTAISDLPGQDLITLIRAVIALASETDPEGGRTAESNRAAVGNLLGRLANRLSDEEIRDLPDDWFDNLEAEYIDYQGDALARIAKAYLAAGAKLNAAAVAVIRRTATVMSYQRGEVHEVAALLDEPVINPGEAWSDAAIADAARLGPALRDLLAHAGTASSAKPSAKWQKTARELLERAGTQEAAEHIRGWLALVGRPRARRFAEMPYAPGINDQIDPFNADAVRGLAWLLALAPEHPDSARTLAALAETALRKVPGVGPRNPKIANAAVHGLSMMTGEDALGQLARLSTRITYKGTLTQVDRALEARAAALCLTREQIDELAVPAFGLTEVGRRVETFGDTTAELVVGRRGAELVWRTGAGKTVKAPPAAVRRDFAEDVKELKAAAKDIDKMLSAQSERIERLFLGQRSWEYAPWRERYLDHPLIGTLARRLIWIVDGTPAVFLDGAMRDLADKAQEPTPGARVELWHPVGRAAEEVLAWRDWLERHEVTQPFKQAHREVYLLTAAEENTRTYSNRFAAHILRQHQFNALAAQRGWRNKLRLMVDDEYPPASRELREWGLRAEFWIEGIGDGADLTDSGSYIYVATDQVRFYPMDSATNWAHAGGGGYRRDGHADNEGPIVLTDVPPLVFSEVMRDADLFVGVASLGNDPAWQDGGPGDRYSDYWRSYSFGELSESASSRADLLGRLLPRLAIGPKCRIDGRFLLVEGTLHTYKIHLGSGNILMSPNDAYLCIVPRQATDRDATSGMFLPFEGDRTLAIVLSKALLLAADDKITDPSILSQIGRR
jgi:hypothetical protein